MADMLNHNQEQFAQFVADGKSQADAYRLAYPASVNWTEASLYSKASTLMSREKVKARVSELRSKLADAALWSREDSVRALLDVMARPDSQKDVIAAVKELNLMHGFNAPTKTEVTGANGSALIPTPVYRIVSE